MDRQERRHNNLVYKLSDRMGDRHLEFLEWKKGKRCGEVDMLTWDSRGRLTFYEVKLTDSRERLKKARKQYYNFLRAHQQNPRDIPGYAYFGDGKMVEL